MRRVAFVAPPSVTDARSAADVDAPAPAMPRGARWLACAGALLAGAAVALWAYAAHAAGGGAAQAALQSAAAIAFGHGLALAALSRLPRRRLGMLALMTMGLGVLLFSGGILVAHLAGVHARTAPFGGTLLIASWLALAVDALRR
jgi:uncharacterized membrane protein YgdD (TMEM256/DUF423 family)